MYKNSMSTVIAAAALAATVAAPSFAWGLGNWGFGGNKYEVASRDARLNREILRDRGYLNGHYNQLRREDAAIRNQERRDLCRNGGYLSYGQTRQLNAEENRLQRQINYDRFRRW